MSAKLRKSAAAIPAYRGASMPAKFLYLYMQTLPKPAGGVLRLSFGQLMEELSMPAHWLKNAMREMTGNGLIQAAGNMVFVPNGIERIANPNMVTSVLRKLEKLDTQEGPVPAAIWAYMMESIEPLLNEKPYLSLLMDYAIGKRVNAPESVTPWDSAADWMRDPVWELKTDHEQIHDHGTNESFSKREISLIQTLVQSTLTTAIPAILEPLMPYFRQGFTPEKTAEQSPVKNTANPTDESLQKHNGHNGYRLPDEFASDVAIAEAGFIQYGGLKQDNPVAFIFPVRPDKNGSTHKVYTNFVHEMERELGDLLDIESSLSNMIAYVEAHPAKIPERSKANKYIWSWMRRKHKQVAERLNEQEKIVSEDSSKANTTAVNTEPEQTTLPIEAEAHAENSTNDCEPPLVDVSDPIFQESLEDLQITEANAPFSEPDYIRESFDAVNTEKEVEPVAKPNQAMQITRKKENDIPEGFLAFWLEYPRHDARVVALKSWKKQGCEKHLESILADIRYRKENKWHDPQFIPMPSTYLNQKRWEDEHIVDTSAFKGHVVKGVVQESSDNHMQKLYEKIDEMDRKEKGDCIDLDASDWRVSQNELLTANNL